MYKVIIVDDEPTIRAGLQTLIDWERYGFVIAGDARNGREALVRHQELRPDLMIIDIRMPGMSGLEAIEEIRKIDSDCHFLILSGYADFSYAKQAIANGVDGYILKPVDEEEMIEELKKIHDALQKEAEMRVRSLINAEERREKRIYSLLFDKAITQTQGSSDNEKLIGAAGGPYQILLLEHRNKDEVDSRNFAAIKERLTNEFETNGWGIVFSFDAYLGVLLQGMVTNETKRDGLFTVINRVVADSEFAVDAAAGKMVSRLVDIRSSFMEAVLLLKYRFLFGGSPILMNENPQLWNLVQDRNKEQTPPDLVSIANRLYYAVDIGNTIEVEHWIELAGLSIAAFNASEILLKASFGQVISTVLNKLAGMGQEINSIVQDYMPMITELYAQPNFTAMKQFVRSRLLELTSQLNSISNQPVLKQMIDFIKRHYNENLKLETLADLFNYNSGYLGKIFKQYTGCHFHTYLDKIRIQRAIALLGEGLKVHQVAERVGYANVDYFHSKFKKYVGDSPSSFKGKTPRLAQTEAGSPSSNFNVQGGN